MSDGMSDVNNTPVDSSESIDSHRIEQEVPVRDPSVDLLAKATAAADRLDKANLQMEDNLKRQEALAIQDTLGGRASVDHTPKEESDEAYAKRVMSNDL